MDGNTNLALIVLIIILCFMECDRNNVRSWNGNAGLTDNIIGVDELVAFFGKLMNSCIRFW